MIVARTKPGTALIPAGGTRHYQDGVPIDGIVRLEIVADDGGFYLFQYARNENLIDTWHDTVDEALDQAAFEYGLGREAWEFIPWIPGQDT